MGRWLSACVALLLIACAEPQAALQVAGVSYYGEELLGLTQSNQGKLAELTAFGVAVARGTADSLGAPLLRRWRRERLGQLLRAEHLLDSLEIEEDALRARYETDPEYELTVRHLLLFSPRFEADATRAQARSKAQRARDRIQAGEDFPSVAAEVSEEPGAEGREGLLQPGREGSWVGEFWSAALALPVEGISPVVETQYGFHVLRLEAREVVPFEEARNQLLLEVARMLGLAEGSAPLPPDITIPEEPELLQRLADLAVPDSSTAVSWSNGTMAMGALRDHFAAMELPLYEAVLDPQRAPTLREAVAEATAWVRTEREARASKIEIDDAFEAELPGAGRTPGAAGPRPWGSTRDRAMIP